VDEKSASRRLIKENVGAVICSAYLARRGRLATFLSRFNPPCETLAVRCSAPARDAFIVRGEHTSKRHGPRRRCLLRKAIIDALKKRWAVIRTAKARKPNACKAA
jgi:hypothetical protein